MIRRVWVRNFRMLAANRFDLGRFAVLVGRNASGKTTMMAALRFVSHLLSDGVEPAVAVALDGSSGGFPELCYDDTEPLAFAFLVTTEVGEFRYEVEVGPGSDGAVAITRENLFRLPGPHADLPLQGSLFDDLAGDELVHERVPTGWKKVASKTREGKDYFADEKTSWNNMFRFGSGRSALGNIPEDPVRFPGAIAVRDLLRDGVMMLELDSHRLRMPSPPRSPTRLLRDGSNLAAAAAALQRADAVAFQQWTLHVGDAVAGLDAIETWERPEDKHVVLRVAFRGGHASPVPSWLLSDGTLRLLALSLLAYAEDETKRGVLLVEEPENGLHPLAIQSAYGALSQLRTTQVFVATHSPVFLAQTSLAETLAFERTPRGTSAVRRGTELAALRQWRDDVRLADVFATGVL